MSSHARRCDHLSDACFLCRFLWQDVAFYINSIFGGPEKLKRLILTDFFRVSLNTRTSMRREYVEFFVLGQILCSEFVIELGVLRSVCFPCSHSMASMVVAPTTFFDAGKSETNICFIIAVLQNAFS